MLHATRSNSSARRPVASKQAQALPAGSVPPLLLLLRQKVEGLLLHCLPRLYQDLTVALKGPVIHPRSRNYYYLERQVLSSFFQAWLGAMDAISGVLSREYQQLQQVVARLLPCIVPLDYYLEDVDQHQSLA